MEQRSEEWFVARCGSIGASQIADLMAKTKSGPAASRKNLSATITVERLTGVNQGGFCSADMQRGIDLEPAAREAYEYISGNEVEEVGLYTHPHIEGTHASPDGVVGDSGLLEIKVPKNATHMEYLLSQRVPKKYNLQMQWQMKCADKEWCDFVSYSPDMPLDLQILIIRVPRDNDLIKEIETEIIMLNHEVMETISSLMRLTI